MSLRGAHARGVHRPATASWVPLVRFAVTAVRRDATGARRAVSAARRSGWARRAAAEVALMLIPNAGYPAGLEALRVLAERWPGRASRTREGSPSAWRRRGHRLCARVYGPVYHRLLAGLRALHPDVAAWVIEEGYGRMLSRPGLPGHVRELVAVGVLAAAGWERQLVSHLLGAARLGASRAEIRQALGIGLRDAPAPGRAAGWRAWLTAFPPGG